MKKILIALLVALSVFALVSCDHEVASTGSGSGAGATMCITCSYDCKTDNTGGNPSYIFSLTEGDDKNYYINADEGSFGHQQYKTYLDEACTQEAQVSVLFASPSASEMCINFESGDYCWGSQSVSTSKFTISNKTVAFTDNVTNLQGIEAKYQGTITITCLDTDAVYDIFNGG